MYNHNKKFKIMEFLKKLWAWLLSQTTIDEQVEAKVTKVKKEVAEVKEVVKKVKKTNCSQSMCPNKYFEAKSRFFNSWGVQKIDLV